MSNRTSIVVLLLLAALVLGSVASIRAQSEPTDLPQLSELGPMPGPFNPNEPIEEQPPASRLTNAG
jgi:hypothetical protein